MEYRVLGESELKLSAVGLGGNVYGPPRLDEQTSVRNIHFAQDKGINFIDTAAIYGQGSSETFVGSATHDRRDKFVLATKFHLLKLAEGESVRERINKHCNTSLKKLRTDYIDLLQIHFVSPGIPQQEILEALNDLVVDGKVRYLGACNYSSWRMRDTLQIAEQGDMAKFISCQNHYNLLRRHVELETLPFCREFNFGFLPYFPLSGGFLTGKYQPGEPAPEGTRGAEDSIIINNSRTVRNETLLAKLEAFAEQRGRNVVDLAFAWLLADPTVTSVIAGTSNQEQIAQNVAAGSWRLTPDEKIELDALTAWDGTGEDIELDPAAYL